MVRAQSLVLVSRLSSGLIASPMSTRNTATCAVAGDEPRGQRPQYLWPPHLLVLAPGLSLPSSSPLPISAVSSLPPRPTLDFPCPASPHLSPLLPQQERVAPHPTAPAEAVGAPSGPLQGAPSSQPAAFAGLLQGREHGWMHPVPIPLPKLGWDASSAPVPARARPHQARQPLEQAVEEEGFS